MYHLHTDSPPPPLALQRHGSPGFENHQDSRNHVAQPECDIFNTTFSLHRASPLFAGLNGLTKDRLQQLSLRLHDILTGDILRGVEVGLDVNGDNFMRNTGALEAVTIGWVTVHTAATTSWPALQASLRYENAVCSAIFLPLPETKENVAMTRSNSFLHLPLLLLRMPVSLKAIVIDFLSTEFDCHVSTLHLTGEDIIRSWECWTHRTAVPITGSLANDAVLTLAFYAADPTQPCGHLESDTTRSMAGPPDTVSSDTTIIGLKTMDIFVPTEELRGFLEAGRQLNQGGVQANSTPFMDALGQYMMHHVALDMAHPSVKVLRIACGGFVLSGSRVKLFATPGSNPDVYSERHRVAISHLLRELVVRAKG